jgi:hypothetical protein
VIHDGFRNRFTIVKDSKTITLVPLSPKQGIEMDEEKVKAIWDWPPPKL